MDRYEHRDRMHTHVPYWNLVPVLLGHYPSPNQEISDWTIGREID
jgi:hypothetical protein